MAGIGSGTVTHSGSACATASAMRVVVRSGGAVHTKLSVPDGEGGWANLAISGCWVFVGEVAGAVAGVGDCVPDSWSVASNALLSIDIVVRGSGVTETFGLVGIEGESRRAASACF